MSKIDIPAVPSGFATTDALNDRFQQIEDEFNNKVLYRTDTGVEPNTMSDELDMGSNKIVNLADGSQTKDAVNVGQVTDLVTNQVNSIIAALPINAGNVLGPASSTDGDLIAFSGATGKILKKAVVNTFAELATTPGAVGQMVFLKCHTTAGRGAGFFQGVSGSVTNDGGCLINSQTGGVYWSRLLEGKVLTDYYNITGNAVNNLPALNNALARSVSALVPLYGSNKNYFGVSGNFVLLDNCEIHDLYLRQLSPSGSVRTFVKTSGTGNIKLYNCKVDRNGTADVNDTQVATDAAGFWIQNQTDVVAHDLEVFGHGQGTGIYFNNIVRGDFKNWYVHDITWWSATTPVTEKAAGIGILDSSKFRLKGFRIENIYSKEGTNPVRRFQTDGIDIGGTNGCSRFSISDGFIANVGEGLDITGSGGNTDFKIFNIHAEDCGFIAFKVANGNNTGELYSCTSVRSGWSGLGIVGTGALITQPVGNFFIHHCFIYDTGANSENPSAPSFDGIQFQEAATQPNAPFNVIMNNMIIVDRQTVKTMDYGIRNYENVGSGQNIILGDGIIIQGAKVKEIASRGTPNSLGRYQHASGSLTAALTHPTTATWQIMIPPIEEYDESAIYDNTTGLFTIKQSGLYDIQGAVSFLANAAGVRGIRVRVTKAPSAVTIYATDIRVPTASDACIPYINRKVILAAGDTVYFEYYQSSGAALNTNTLGTYLQLTQLRY